MVGWGLVVVVLGGPPLLVGGRAPAPSVTAGRPSLACRGHIQGACAVRKNKQVIKNEEFSLMIEISITFGSFKILSKLYNRLANSKVFLNMDSMIYTYDSTMMNDSDCIHTNIHMAKKKRFIPPLNRSLTSSNIHKTILGNLGNNFKNSALILFILNGIDFRED